MVGFIIEANVSGLCDGGAIDERQLIIASKLNSSTIVELMTFSPTVAKPFLAVVFIYFLIIHIP